MMDSGFFNQDDFEFNKRVKDVLNTAKKNSKKEECYLCKKEKKSFCDSHSLPHFILKNISNDGYVYTFNKALELPFFKEKIGKGVAGIFNIICRDCDKTFFTEYEDPKNYVNLPSQKMMAQIALKTALKEIDKKYQQQELYKQNNFIIENNFFIHYLLNGQRIVTELDLNGFQKDADFALKNLEKDNIYSFYLIYYKKLNYNIPIACQTKFLPIFDFNGNILNNVFDYERKKRFSDMHLCFFPLKEYSVVFAFVRNNDKTLRNLFKKIKTFSENEQLQFFSYMAFLYSEEIFINTKLQNIIEENKFLREISKTTSNYLFTKRTKKEAILNIKEKFNLLNFKKFPNLLLKI